MEGGYIGRKGIARKLAAIKQAVEKLARPRRLTRTLFALFSRVLGFGIVVRLGFFFCLSRTWSYRIINSFQAVLDYSLKQRLAVRGLQLGWYPAGYAVLKLPLVLPKPGSEVIAIEDRRILAEFGYGS